MKIVMCSMVAVTLSLGAAQAQSLNKTTPDGKENSPGTTGAMGNVSSTGIATDAGGVKQQQGAAAKASAGTVGAAPGSTSQEQPK